MFVGKIYAMVEKNDTVAIDFSDTTRLWPCGTLYFVAHIETLIKKYPTKKITCSYPKDEVVEQLFQHIGFLNKLGLVDRKSITSDMVKYWFYLKGQCADMSGMRSLFYAHKQSISKQNLSFLYASASEAVTNVTNHAYPDTFEEVEKNWWMFAQHRDNNLLIVVFDNGIGIPGSFIIKEEVKEKIARWFSFKGKKFDGWIIRQAVTSRKNSSKLPFRGNGLPDMLDFTTEVGGELTVLSAKGLFRYSVELNRSKSVSFDNDLNGTMILWKIPLRERNPS